jgi:hypothetical protein
MLDMGGSDAQRALAGALSASELWVNQQVNQHPLATPPGGAVVDGVVFDREALEAKEVELAELSAHLDAATHRQLTLIRIMDLSEHWARRGAKTCAHWLSWRIGLDPGAARERVRVARKLVELPAIDESLRRGELSYSKARAVTRVATRDLRLLAPRGRKTRRIG